MSDDVTMDPATARVILEGLIEGVNPFTGDPVADDACLDPDTQAALKLAAAALEQTAAEAQETPETETAKPKARKTRGPRKPAPVDEPPADELRLF